jgi:FkbM family methyltransferase
LLDLIAKPARWKFLPGFLRAGYALLLKRIFSLIRVPVIVHIPNLGSMRLEPWDMIDSRIMFFHIWEPAISQFMRDTIRPGSVVADIGANIGYYSLLMSRAVGPNGHVFAVEPSPEIRVRLADTIERNGLTNVTIIPYGISDRSERRSFQLSSANLGASKFGEESADGLELRQLQDVIPPEMLAQTSFIKIDVEGMEAPVMRDLQKLLLMFPKQLAICAELRIDDTMAALVQEFQAHGMDCLTLPNHYAMFSYPGHPITPEKVTSLPHEQLDVALIRR